MSANNERAAHLRLLAAQLLEEAEDIDGLRPFAVSHRGAFGAETLVVWHQGYEADQAGIAALLPAPFEPEKGEALDFAELSFDQMVGRPLEGDLLAATYAKQPEGPPTPSRVVHGLMALRNEMTEAVCEMTGEGLAAVRRYAWKAPGRVRSGLGDEEIAALCGELARDCLELGHEIRSNDENAVWHELWTNDGDYVPDDRFLAAVKAGYVPDPEDAVPERPSGSGMKG